MFVYFYSLAAVKRLTCTIDAHAAGRIKWNIVQCDVRS